MQKDHRKQVLRIIRSAAERMLALAGQAMAAGYRFCYGTGVQTIRFMKYTGRRLKKVLAPVGRVLYKMCIRDRFLEALPEGKSMLAITQDRGFSSDLPGIYTEK